MTFCTLTIDLRSQHLVRTELTSVEYWTVPPTRLPIGTNQAYRRSQGGLFMPSALCSIKLMVHVACITERWRKVYYGTI